MKQKKTPEPEVAYTSLALRRSPLPNRFELVTHRHGQDGALLSTDVEANLAYFAAVTLMKRRAADLWSPLAASLPPAP